jgi:hypothetical protein
MEGIGIQQGDFFFAKKAKTRPDKSGAEFTYKVPLIGLCLGIATVDAKKIDAEILEALLWNAGVVGLDTIEEILGEVQTKKLVRALEIKSKALGDKLK